MTLLTVCRCFLAFGLLSLLLALVMGAASRSRYEDVGPAYLLVLGLVLVVVGGVGTLANLP